MTHGNTTRGVTGLGLLGVIALAGWTGMSDDERDVTLDQVPPTVRTTLLRVAGDGRILEIERHTGDGTTVYEADVLIQHEKIEVSIGSDGTLLSREGDEDADEREREITKADVPPAALATLKRLAGDATLTAFSEEIEHGHTFYEGSWSGRGGGHVDALVTAAGAHVETEEAVGPNQLPQAVSRAAREVAGGGAPLTFEKKTVILYEVKFRKGDRHHELLLTPDGRRIEEEVASGHEDGDDDDHDGDHDDGDDHDDDDDD